jgi:hypothetical protein
MEGWLRLSAPFTAWMSLIDLCKSKFQKKSRKKIRCREDNISWMFGSPEDRRGHDSSLLVISYLSLAIALSQLEWVMYQHQEEVVRKRTLYNKSNLCSAISGLSVPKYWPSFPVGNKKEKVAHCTVGELDIISQLGEIFKVFNVIMFPYIKQLLHVMHCMCHNSLKWIF